MKIMPFAIALMVTDLVCAATVTYTGLGTDSADLSDTANWSASSWTASDTLVVNGTATAIPASGFVLTKALPVAASLQFKNFSASALTVDTKGFLTTITNVYTEGMNTVVKFVGGASNLTMLKAGWESTIQLSDGVYAFAEGGRYVLSSANSAIEVLSGARLELSKISTGGSCGPSNSDSSGLRILGGEVVTKNRQDATWSTQNFDSPGSFFDLRDGGVFRDDTTAPMLRVRATVGTYKKGYFLVDGGSIIMTNASWAPRALELCPQKTTVAFTNAVVLVHAISCGPFSARGWNEPWYSAMKTWPTGGTFTFHDTVVTNAFRPGSSYNGYAGLLVGDTTSTGKVNNVGNTFLFDGPKNRYVCDWFAPGGTSNQFEVADGVVEAKRVSVGMGKDSSLAVTGGRLTARRIESNDQMRWRFRVSAPARVEVTGESDHGVTQGIVLSKASGLFMDGGTLIVAPTVAIVLNATNDVLVTGSGSVVTGRVSFTGNECRYALADGAEQTVAAGAASGTSGIAFAANGMNNVFAISNATFRSALAFASGGSSPFVNVPGCRLEFAGESPKFVVTASSGATAFASGTASGEALANPVRLRFALPETPYAEAAVQVTQGKAVLGGNAEFEFDFTALPRTSARLDYPLVYCADGFASTDVDVAGLNATNADRLAACERNARFRLSSDHKTLMLTVSSSLGLTVVIR